MIWVNQVVQGVLLGGYYALLATGLSLLFGVMRIINLAHGDLAVLGTFLLWWLHDRTGMSVFVALAIVLPVMAALGWILQRAMFERSLRSGVLVPLLATFGLAIVLQNLLFEKFGADTRSLDIGSLAYDGWKITDQIYIGQSHRCYLAKCFPPWLRPFYKNLCGLSRPRQPDKPDASALNVPKSLK